MHLNISEAGVSLIHIDEKIENGSALSINLIGTAEMALICKTNKGDCCATPPNRHGQWYCPDGTEVLISAESSKSFYRDRTDQGEVRLNKRNNMQITTGMYCCEIPDSNDNCGITQKVCVNLGELTNALPGYMHS